MADVDAVKLSDAFLQRLVTEICDPPTVAVGLFGSHSRGMATQDSDIDLTRMVHVPLADPGDRFALRMWEDRLVSILTTTFVDLAQAFAQPEQVVWSVPALRDARILYDPTGRLSQLQQDAVAFQWEPLQPAADAYASRRLLKFAEEAHSLAGALGHGDGVKAMTETTWLVVGLPLVVAVQRGIFLLNETKAPQQVQDALGRSLGWARSYRVAAGLEPDQAGQMSVWARGLASLRLYVSTVELLRPVLTPAHAAVIESVLARVQRAGFWDGSENKQSDPS